MTELATGDSWFQREGETLWELPEGAVVIREEVIGSDVVVAMAEASIVPSDPAIEASAEAAFEGTLAELAAIRNDAAEEDGGDGRVEDVGPIALEDSVMPVPAVEAVATDYVGDVQIDSQGPALLESDAYAESVEADAGIVQTLANDTEAVTEAVNAATVPISSNSAADAFFSCALSGITLLDVPDDVLALVSAMLCERDACALAASCRVLRAVQLSAACAHERYRARVLALLEAEGAEPEEGSAEAKLLLPPFVPPSLPPPPPPMPHQDQHQHHQQQPPTLGGAGKVVIEGAKRAAVEAALPATPQ